MELTIFQFKTNQVRVIILTGIAWFVTKDVAEVLGYTDASMMLKHVDEEDKQTINPQTLDSVVGTETFGSNTFRLSLINESGLYAAILGSRKPEAKELKRWVTSEVLPSIRATGNYSLVKQHTIPATYADALLEAGRLAKELEVAETHRALLAAKVEADAPLVKLSETLTIKNVDSVSVGDLARSYGIGRTIFFDKLRQIEFIQQKPSRQPYQRHIDAGRAEVYRKERIHQPGIFDSVTVLTAKGQEYIAAKLLELEQAERTEVVLEASVDLV